MKKIKKESIKATVLQLKGYLIAALLGFFISFMLNILFSPIFVSGNSMYPTYENGNWLKCDKHITRKDITYGDIVVFTHKNKDYIKRVIALPGDKVQVIEGILYVNDIKSDYQFELIEDAGELERLVILSTDMYFCLGDNRNNSTDCRAFGPIHFDEINCKIIDKYF